MNQNIVSLCYVVPFTDDFCKEETLNFSGSYKFERLEYQSLCRKNSLVYSVYNFVVWLLDVKKISEVSCFIRSINVSIRRYTQKNMMIVNECRDGIYVFFDHDSIYDRDKTCCFENISYDSNYIKIQEEYCII